MVFTTKMNLQRSTQLLQESIEQIRNSNRSTRRGVLLTVVAASAPSVSRFFGYDLPRSLEEAAYVASAINIIYSLWSSRAVDQHTESVQGLVQQLRDGAGVDDLQTEISGMRSDVTERIQGLERKIGQIHHASEIEVQTKVRDEFEAKLTALMDAYSNPQSDLNEVRRLEHKLFVSYDELNPNNQMFESIFCRGLTERFYTPALLALASDAFGLDEAKYTIQVDIEELARHKGPYRYNSGVILPELPEFALTKTWKRARPDPVAKNQGPLFGILDLFEMFYLKEKVKFDAELSIAEEEKGLRELLSGLPKTTREQFEEGLVRIFQKIPVIYRGPVVERARQLMTQYNVPGLEPLVRAA